MLRNEHGSAESLVYDDSLVPIVADRATVVERVRVQVQMSRLHELVHKVDGLRLFKAVDIAAPGEHVVCLKSTVLLVVVVECPANDAAPLLLHDNKKTECFDGPARKRTNDAVYVACMRVDTFHTQPLEEHIATVKTPG